MPHDDLPGSRQSHGVLQHHLRETASTAARTPATLARDWASRSRNCQRPERAGLRHRARVGVKML